MGRAETLGLHVHTGIEGTDFGPTAAKKQPATA